MRRQRTIDSPAFCLKHLQRVMKGLVGDGVPNFFPSRSDLGHHAVKNGDCAFLHRTSLTGPSRHNWMMSVFLRLRDGVAIVLAIWGLVVLPLLLFRKTRSTGAAILMYSSFYTRFTCWWYGFIITYMLAGGWSLFFGLIMMGVGVVPLVIITSALHGEWFAFWNLILAVVLVFVPRAIVTFVVYRAARREEAEQKLLSQQELLRMAAEEAEPSI